jgi:hypothetical protein
MRPDFPAYPRFAMQSRPDVIARIGRQEKIGDVMNWNEMGHGMGLGMGFGWIGWILILVLLVLAIAALMKYLRK